MNPMPKFQYHAPKTLAGALVLMDELDKAKPIIGGTDLMIAMKEAACTPSNIVDLNKIFKLNYIKEKNEQIRIGATTTLNQVAISPETQKLPALIDAVSRMGSPQIRNRGTITGNICNASPAADSAPSLLVHGAEIKIESVDETRIIPVDELFAGPKINSLEPNELITEIRIPIPPENSASSYHRIGRRKAFTLSVVSSAGYIEMEGEFCVEAKLAFGSVAMTPIRAMLVEQMFKDKELTDELILEASEAVKEYVSPITDVRGTAEYRKDMCEVLMRRALNTCLERVS